MVELLKTGGYLRSFLRGEALSYGPDTVNSRYLRIEVHPKLLIFESKFSGPRKFTFKYQ